MAGFAMSARTLAVVCAALAIPAMACADLASSAPPRIACPLETFAPAPQPAPDLVSLAHLNWLLQSARQSQPLPQAPLFAPVELGDPPAAQPENPSAPSSLTLVLSGVLSLGAFQGVRSIKKLHLAALPEWYHTGGPAQVGHATPFDLQFDALPECAFQQPVEAPAPAWHILRERRTPLRCQTFVPLAAPRGPPLSYSRAM